MTSRGALRAALAAGAVAAAIAADLPRRVIDHPYFQVRSIVVTGGGYRLEDRDVIAWLGLSDGVSVWRIDARKLSRRLLRNPLVRSARVYRVLPHTLRIEIVERRPVAIALLDRPYYVDEDGVVFLEPGPRDDVDYPVLTGIDPQWPVGRRIWLARRGVRILRLAEEHAGLGEVSEVHLRADGEVTVYLMHPRTALFLGRTEWRERLAMAEHVLARIEAKAAPTVVDLRFEERVFVRFRPGLPVALPAGEERIT